MISNGRIVGIDHGQARIGVALSDPSGIVARPYGTIVHVSNVQDFDKLREIVNGLGVVKVVVGIPTSSTGGLTAQANIVIDWAHKLSQVLEVPILMWDESYSTIDAAHQLKTRKKSNDRDLDSVAAACILQNYLDNQESKNGEPGIPIETYSRSW